MISNSKAMDNIDGGEPVGAQGVRCARYHLITPVWGDTYTRLFIEVCLPTLLAAGNIPSLSETSECLYQIFTSPRDRVTIEESPAYKLLAETVFVEFHEIRAVVGNITNQYHVQSDAYRRGIAAADAANAATIFLNADAIYADGGLRTVNRIIQSGKRAILALGIRLNKNAVVPRLVEQYRSVDLATISITPRELVAMGVRNLHQIAKTHYYHAEGVGLHPAGLFWQVGDSGILARCFHLHPVVVYPKRKNASFSTTIDNDYLATACPDKDDIYVLTDSDEFCAFELSEEDRQMSAIPRTGDLRDIAQWAHFNANDDHRALFEEVIRIHAGQENIAEWAAAEAESTSVVNDVLSLLKDDNLKSRWGRNIDLPPVPIQLVSVLRSEECADIFLNATLPSLLALENIPALPNMAECSYQIFIDRDLSDRVRNAAVVLILQEYLHCEIVVLEKCSRWVAIQDALAMGTTIRSALVHVAPGMLFSDGSLAAVAAKLRAGFDLILLSTLQVNRDPVVDFLKRDFVAGGIVTISSKALAHLALTHLHDDVVQQVLDVDAPVVNLPRSIWRIGNEGVIVRSAALLPFAIVSKSGMHTYLANGKPQLLNHVEYSDKSTYMVRDSDEAFCCEFVNAESLEQTGIWHGREALFEWLDRNTNAYQRMNLLRAAWVHTGLESIAAWNDIEARSRATISGFVRAYEEKRVTGKARSAQDELRNAVRAVVFEAREHLASRGRQTKFHIFVASTIVGAFVVARACIRVYWIVRRTFRRINNSRH